MNPTLVILAAGLGSRYGGLKQLDAVGPAGETILDYAVADAREAGFARVVFVIRRDFEAIFRQQIGAKYAGSLAVGYAFQSVDTLPAGCVAPAGRTKPWGTGHAVWCARDEIDGPFAVINADDFYGRDSFRRLAGFFREAVGSTGRARFASVGFQLANTLSENGAVSRGLCALDANGNLAGITEHTGILREQVGPGAMFSGREIVSMNCWAFTSGFLPALERHLRAFLRDHGAHPTAEFYLPSAVSAMIAAGEAEVGVLPTQSSWLGITYADDRPRVVAALAALAERGEYRTGASPVHAFP